MKQSDEKKLEEAREKIKRIIEMQERERRIRDKMDKIKYKIAIISGKGGVGKSTITSLLALSLASRGYKVCIFDSDFHGPTIPKMLGVESEFVRMTEDKELIPPEGPYGIKVMSIHYFLPNATTAVIWRGPLKRSFLEELLDKTNFGDTDIILFDLPPGCLPSNTIIYRYPYGPIQLSSLKPGDYVYSFNGDIEQIKGKIKFEATFSKSKVLDIIPQGIHDIYEVRTSNRRIRGTANHPILTLLRFMDPGRGRYRYELCWLPISNLKRGDYIVVLKKLPRKRSVKGETWYLEIYPNSRKKNYGAGLIRGRYGIKILNEYFGIEEVRDVVYVGRDDVYDIVTDNMHNFIANGIVVHNTGDEALNLAQVIPNFTGVIAVTQPTDVSAIAVAKALDFARKLKLKILGIIENMSFFIPPGEGKMYKVFKGSGGEMLSEKYGVPLLGQIPIDPIISEFCDKGLGALIVNQRTRIIKMFNSIVDKLLEILGEKHQ